MEYFIYCYKNSPHDGGAILNKTHGSAIAEWCSANNGLLMYYHARTFVERISWFGGEGLFSFPILVPMWYIRDLMVLLLLSPLIYISARRKIFLVIVLFIYVTGVYPFIPGLSPSPLLFFSAGVFMSLKGRSIIETMHRYRYISYTAFIISWMIIAPLGGYRTAEGNYFYPFFIISGVISIINILSIYVKKEETTMRENKIMSFFRKNEDKCFLIYAAHVFILPYISIMLKNICKIITNDADVNVLFSA